MSTIDHLSQFVTLAACVLVICIAEPALNRCTVQTRRCIRLALLLICAGAILTVGAILPGGLASPWPGAAALATGLALMLFSNRRRRRVIL